MKRYKEISLAELFELIMKDEIKEIYVKNNGNLEPASKYNWSLTEFKKYKWFKREVME
ncbi:MAG TPA: hypothetical protein GX497_05545 [Bacillus bacterium]|nr:hypothetical protein [Bacillus sp. (in: firmicutes)]